MAITRDEAGDVAYYGEDEVFRWRIGEALMRLPDDVARFALARCRFVSVGRATHGMVLPGRIGTHHYERRSRNMWIILLDENVAEANVHSAIAHEIAHAWRRDDRLGEPPKDCEEQTARLVEKWGFTGIGADPRHCEGTVEPDQT